MPDAGERQQREKGVDGTSQAARVDEHERADATGLRQREAQAGEPAQRVAERDPVNLDRVQEVGEEAAVELGV